MVVRLLNAVRGPDGRNYRLMAEYPDEYLSLEEGEEMSPLAVYVESEQDARAQVDLAMKDREDAHVTAVHDSATRRTTRVVLSDTQRTKLTTWFQLRISTVR